MAEPIDVFFTVQEGATRADLWTRSAADLAAELGFRVRLNPLTGRPSPEEWAEQLADVEALITTWGAPTLDATVLARNSVLKIVGHAAGSVANIVSAHLYDRGVRVVTANSAMARMVAEWNLMMTLVAARRLQAYASFGSPAPPDAQRRDLARSPSELVIGIWGFGDVARCLVELLAPLGPARILVHDAYLTAADAAALGIEKATFEELVDQSDILHALTGLTPANKGRLGKEMLGRLKNGATLINAGRAPLIEKDALLDVLKTGRISAILDVHYREPVPPDDPFLGLPNVIMTPHCAGRPRRDRYVPLVLREFRRFFNGEALQHEICRDRAVNMTDSKLVRG